MSKFVDAYREQYQESSRLAEEGFIQRFQAKRALKELGRDAEKRKYSTFQQGAEITGKHGPEAAAKSYINQARAGKVASAVEKGLDSAGNAVKNIPGQVRSIPGKVSGLAHGAVDAAKAVASHPGESAVSAFKAGGHAIAGGIEAMGRHPGRTIGGAAGLGVIGAAALAHKAIKSLRAKGVEDPSDDELHGEMKKHHEMGTDDGHLNSNPPSALGHGEKQSAHSPSPGPGYKMTFGTWKKQGAGAK